MREFDESTLWRVSAYERFQVESGHAGVGRLTDSTVLPTTLTADLSALERRRLSDDVIEVLAACIRRAESALVLLRHRGLVWPLTVFPRHNLYHLPRSIIEELDGGNRDMAVLSVQPPRLRIPGHPDHERVRDAFEYRPLAPLLWTLALKAPRAHLLEDISGHVAYRASSDFLDEGIALAGALTPLVRRLRREVSSLPEIAQWPGMDEERAARVLNAIYLQGGLIVLRSPRLARHGQGGRLLGWLRSGRSRH